MSSYLKAQGWSKIRKAEALITTSDCTSFDTFAKARAHLEAMADLGYRIEIDGEYVGLLLQDGGIAMVTVNRGESAEALAAHYRQRGYTDSRCC